MHLSSWSRRLTVSFSLSVLFLVISPATTLRAQVDEFDDDPLASPDWELYAPRDGVTFATDDSSLRVTIPAGIVLDHWAAIDNATQLRRADAPEDFIMETSVLFTGSGDPEFPFWPPSDQPYQACLMVKFSQRDVFYWGFYRGTTLVVERSGQNNLCRIDPGLQEVQLRVTKTGDRYTFSYREDDDADWVDVCQRTATEPVEQVGLMFKSWNPAIADEQTFEFDYFSIEEVPDAPPTVSISCDSPGNDRAWASMPYLRHLEIGGQPIPDVTTPRTISSSKRECESTPTPPPRPTISS